MASVGSGAYTGSSVINPNHVAKVGNDFGGTWNGADILSEMLNRYTSTARQFALEDRAYTAMREDTAIQRRLKDIEAAGLNPWLAVQSGLGEGAAASASQVGKETNDALQIANSAAAVLGQYASLPTKNFNQLANGLKKIVDALVPWK